MKTPSPLRVTATFALAALVASSCSSNSKGAGPATGGSEVVGLAGTSSAGRSEGGSGGAGQGTVAGSATGAAGAGGKSSTSGGASSGGVSSGGVSSGGVSPTAGTTSGGASTAGGGSGNSGSLCDDPKLVWKSANKTNYESYPDPGSQECIEFNGCTWEGQFAACDGKKTEAWVMAHDIVAAFPDFKTLELHDLCLRQGTKTIVVTVLDTCGDSDCDGCCTENRGSADQLIDLEKYTNQRWGVADGRIEWADLGPTRGGGCD